MFLGMELEFEFIWEVFLKGKFFIECFLSIFLGFKEKYMKVIFLSKIILMRDIGKLINN